jgi:hypothetical protein
MCSSLDDPSCGIATFGGIAALLMSNPLAGQGASPKGPSRRWRDRAGPAHRRQDPARARLHRGGRGVLRGLRQPPRARTPGLRAKAFEALAALPGRRRGADLLALYIAGTQSQADQTYAAYREGGGDPGKAVRQAPGPSGRRALPDPQLRRAADRAKGLTARAAMRHRAGCAARAAHAVAHLHARRLVGGIDRHQPALRRRWRGRGDGPTSLPRRRLHGLRAPAAGRDDEARRDWTRLQLRRRRQGGTVRRDSVRRRGDARALCRRARRLEGRGAAQAVRASSPFVEAITHFARALGAARSGDAAAAEKDAERSPGSTSALLEAKNAYWATEVEVQRLAAAAWIAQGEGQATTRAA